MFRPASDPSVISGLSHQFIQHHNPHPAHQGQIQVIFGPMFSGKTTELIRRCKRFQLANYKCVVVKYAKDNRYFNHQDEISTHDRCTLPAIPAVELTSLKQTLLKFEVIAIDEGQFFPDTVKIAEELANKGKVVIVAALDGDFKRDGFGNILNLVPLAESVVKLTAVCMVCYKSASYTKRTSNDTALEVIGGSDKYIAVCRECHSENTADDGESKIESKDESKNLELNGRCQLMMMMNGNAGGLPPFENGQQHYVNFGEAEDNKKEKAVKNHRKFEIMG